VTRLQRLCLLLACCVAGPALAQVTVTSSRPDSVTLTVYRQGVAQVTETRQVELPAGPVSLVFEGVADTLLPRSAVVAGAERPLAEINFDFDQLSPASLLERSVGKTVTIVRTNRRTGTVVREAATILSASGTEGVVIRTEAGSEALKCSGFPERLEFNEIPANLGARPALSVRLAAGAPGKRMVTVSYLVHGISWSADYVAQLNQKANRMNLGGWATLTNDTGVSFEQAWVQLVSGELELQHGDYGGSRPAYSWPSPVPGDEDYEAVEERRVSGSDMSDPRLLLSKCIPLPAIPVPGARASGGADEEGLEEVEVTGTRIRRESLGDYKLYRLPERISLKSRQTKQAVFLSKPRVKVDRFYKLETQDFVADEDDYRYLVGARATLRWRNDRAAGLGEPLPGGRVRVFESFTGNEVFAGDVVMRDKPVGLDVEIVYGFNEGISAQRSRSPSPDELDERAPRLSVKVEHRIFNGKSSPVTVVVQYVSEYLRLGAPRIRNSSARTRSQEGDPSWRIRIPAGAERVLRYQIEADNLRYTEDDEDE
jgi:hypothetical protein